MDQDLLEIIFRYICDYIERVGYAPSIREISRNCYVSQSNLYRYFDLLEIQGRITRDPGRARSITITPVPKPR
jgi:hypothetical protein